MAIHAYRYIHFIYYHQLNVNTKSQLQADISLFSGRKKIVHERSFYFLDKGKWATTENSYLPQTCFQTVYL